MPKTQRKLQPSIYFILPLALVVLIMLPRLISPQFGLLDDGAMLAEVRQILSGDLGMSHDLQAGRFRPLYWGYFTLIYALAGPAPLWFFLAQTCVFLALVKEIQVLMKLWGAKPLQRLVTSLVFVLAVPIIENFYTLSKGEPLQLVFLLLALIGFEKLTAADRTRLQWMQAAFISLSIFAAMLVKETTLVMVPIAVLWAGASFFHQKQRTQDLRRHRRIQWLFLGAVLLGILAAMGLRALWSTTSLAGGTYTERYDFSVQSLLGKTARWATMYAYYFHFLLPLGLLTLILFIQGRQNFGDTRQRLLDWLIWCLAWAAALLPWEFTEVYYLLPFSLGAAILMGWLSPLWIRAVQRQANGHWVHKFLLGLSLVLFLLTLPNVYTHAGIQLTMDRTNQAMLGSVQNITPADGVVFIGFDAQNEIVINIERFLRDRFGRTDIDYDFVSLETLGGLHHYSKGILVLPYVRNQPDLILRTGMDEQFTIAWREIILYEMEGRLKTLDRERGSFQMLSVNLPVLLCPVLGPNGFCETPDPIIDTRQFRFGWEVVQIR